MTTALGTTADAPANATHHVQGIYGAGIPQGSHIYHAFWTRFPPPPYAAQFFIGIWAAVVGLLALTGNGFVVYVFYRFRSLRTPGNKLIMNLALSDMMLAATNIPMYSVSSFAGSWVFGENGCALYGFCGALFGLLSINTIAAVALDRYLVIARSQLVQARSSHKISAYLIAGAWVNSLIWSLPPLFGWNNYLLEGYQTSCSYDYLTQTVQYVSLVLAMFFGGFVLPLSLIVLCYVYIFCTVYKHESGFRETSRCLNARVMCGVRERAYNTEIRTAKTILTVLFFYLVSWTPYAVVSIIGVSGHSELLTPVASVLPGIMAKMSTIYNPIIYTLMHPNYRKKVRMLMLNSDRGLSSSFSLEMARTIGRAGTVTRTDYSVLCTLPAQQTVLPTKPASIRLHNSISIKTNLCHKEEPIAEETSLQTASFGGPPSKNDVAGLLDKNKPEITSSKDESGGFTDTPSSIFQSCIDSEIVPLKRSQSDYIGLHIHNEYSTYIREGIITSRGRCLLKKTKTFTVLKLSDDSDSEAFV